MSWRRGRKVAGTVHLAGPMISQPLIMETAGGIGIGMGMHRDATGASKENDKIQWLYHNSGFTM